MADVAGFLAELQLTEYAGAFEAQGWDSLKDIRELDMKCLTELMDSDTVCR